MDLPQRSMAPNLGGGSSMEHHLTFRIIFFKKSLMVYRSIFIKKQWKCFNKFAILFEKGENIYFYYIH